MNNSLTPDALTEESLVSQHKELMSPHLASRNSELELQLTSSTQSAEHSPRSHDMSSPFIEHPQSPLHEKTGSPKSRTTNNKSTINFGSSRQEKQNGRSHYGNEFGSSSPVKDESFVDNSIDESHLRHHTPLKMINNNVSPWRQFRPPSYTNVLQNSSKIFNNKPDLKYSTTDSKPAASEMSTQSEIKKLNDEVYHYQVKIKTMSDFLRNLVEKGSFDTSEIQLIIAHVDAKSDQQQPPQPPQPPQLLLLLLMLELLKRNEELEADWKESLEIINELNANIETYQRCMDKQSAELDYLLNVLFKCHKSIKEFADYLNKDEKLAAWSIALEQLLDKSLEDQAELLIRIAKEIINAAFNKATPVSKKINSPLTPPESTYGLDNTTNLVNEIEELRKEKRMISERHASAIEQLKDRSQEIQELQKKVEAERELNMKLKESLDSSNKGNAQEVMHLQARIDKLERDSRDMESHSAQATAGGNNEMVPIAQYDSLVTQHHDLQNAYASLLEELNQLRESSIHHPQAEMEKAERHSTNLESTYLSDRTNNEMALRTELNRAMKQQELREAEHAQMSYMTSTLKKENEELQSKLKKLTDFVTYSNNNEKEQVVKKLSVIEFQFKDLLKFDLGEFQKLIQSFNKIAEDESLLNPIRRYERIKKTLVADLDESSVRTLRENHKSVFEYFVRATDILINNYVRLLLAEEETHSTEAWRKQVSKLKEQNDHLENALKALQREKLLTASSSLEPGSPNSQLRLNDIRQKWKAERERRIMEDKEAKKRYNELRNELARSRS